MFHGFSRRMLNVLIIGCLLIITWIQFGFQDNEETPLEPLHAPPLSDLGWHYWRSNENVPVAWQTFGHDQLHLVIQREKHEPLHLSLPLDNWASALSHALPRESNSTKGVVVLQGSADTATMQQAAAFVIRQLQLMPPEIQTNNCQLEYLAGAYWWNHRTGNSLAEPAVVDRHSHALSDTSLSQGTSGANKIVPSNIAQNTTLPTRDEWQSFRENAVHELRQKWLSPSAAIDIQAELAYHRWPETYFYDLYQDLATAQRTAPAAFVECLTR